MQFRFLLFCAVVLALSACRRLHARRAAWRVGRAVSAPSVRPTPPTPNGGSVSVARSVRDEPMPIDSVAAVDGRLAVLTADGTLRVVESGAGTLSVREIVSPCHPPPRSAYWTTSPHLAVDTNGHVCCVSRGDLSQPSGAYCATLDGAPVRWQHVVTPWVVQGVGSGFDAISIFGPDVACTSDGGRSLVASFRGDPDQPVSAASCNALADVVAVAGTRAPGARMLQTVRYARRSGALSRVEDAPRGEPVATLVEPAGDAYVGLRTPAGDVLVRIDASQATHVTPRHAPLAPTIGGWGDAVIVADGAGIEVFRQGISIGSATWSNGTPTVLAVTRIGATMVAVTTDGRVAALTH